MGRKEPNQTNKHTQSMDVDELRSKVRPVYLLNMSAWAFIGSYCAYAISTKITSFGLFFFNLRHEIFIDQKLSRASFMLLV